MSQTRDERVIREATFNRKVRTYWLLSGALILTATVVGIVLLPFWFLIGNFVIERYLRRLRCVLTDRSLQVRKGLLIRVEKTVPLDKITDVGLVQGPVMRFLDLEALSVETAGQSSQGALIQLTGITDAHGFRDAVLKQRDVVIEAQSVQVAASEKPVAGAGDQELLVDIRDTLHRIEERLAE